MTTATQNSKSTNESAGKGLTAGDKTKAAEKAAAKPAQGNVGRIKPWADLVADPKLIEKGPAPREKTVFYAMYNLLKERGPKGATLDEIKASFPATLSHHDPKALCIWVNKNRGYGFHMKKDGHIVLRTKADE